MSDTNRYSNIRVLLVEDNTVNQQLMVDLLSEYKIAVDVASNGKDAVDLLVEKRKQDTFDLIFMDCQMPIMDGYEATRQLRRLDEYKDIPILALSGHVLPQEIEKARQAGMNDFITKPIEFDDVLNKIEEWTTPRKSPNPVTEQPLSTQSVAQGVSTKAAERPDNNSVELVNIDKCLLTLEELIANCDIDSIDIATDLNSRYANTENAEQLELLSRSLYEFDFQTAAIELKTLKNMLLD